MADAKEQAEQLRKDYKETFESEAGQRVLEHLRQVCFSYDSTLNQSPHVMACNEGQRMVILHIETKLKFTAEKLKELQNERGQSES